MSRWSHLARVVVAYDGSDPSRVALARGIEESQARSVPLHIVTVVDDALFYGVSTTRTDAAEAALSEAEKAAVPALGEGWVTTRAAIGSPVTVLLGSCAPDDLLVVGSRGHRRLARIVLGSTSSSLVIHAPCPVLVCRENEDGASGPVLVGVDGSDASRLAVAFAAELADRKGALLRAVLAVPPVVDAFGVVTGPDESSLDVANDLLAECLEGVREDRPNLQIEKLVVQSHPLDALLEHAQQARLVAVGSRGRGALASILLGSTGRGLAQQAPCSVLVARTPAVEGEHLSSHTRSIAARGRGVGRFQDDDASGRFRPGPLVP